MSIARDGEGTLERIFLDGGLATALFVEPFVELKCSSLATALFFSGTKVDEIHKATGYSAEKLPPPQTTGYHLPLAPRSS